MKNHKLMITYIYEDSMDKIVCSKCKKVYDVTSFKKCPRCGSYPPIVYNYQNSDDYLNSAVPKIQIERKKSGLLGLVKGLECIISNVEPNRQVNTMMEIISTTGYKLDGIFENEKFKNFILKCSNSPDFIITSRKKRENPFHRYNDYPKTKNLPNTRLEAFIFKTNDIEKYVSIQKERGIQFLTDDIIHYDNYSFIQTAPSKYTGNSIGILQWHQNKGKYIGSNDKDVIIEFEKQDKKYLNNIKQLDHAATRVRAQDRDASIIEFMELTNYNFEFAIYVKIFNSITNVARLSQKDFAMVFTSGVTPYVDDKSSGPTEKFIHNYGSRVHHLAFHTEHIEDTIHQLKEDGMDFLIGLVGSPEEGLKQTFSQTSVNTLLVNEYIYRYGDFDGFFTKSNVTLLTGATEKQ
jgi:hypothetical protein